MMVEVKKDTFYYSYRNVLLVGRAIGSGRLHDQATFKYYAYDDPDNLAHTFFSLDCLHGETTKHLSTKWNEKILGGNTIYMNYQYARRCT